MAEHHYDVMITFIGGIEVKQIKCHRQQKFLCFNFSDFRLSRFVRHDTESHKTKRATTTTNSNQKKHKKRSKVQTLLMFDAGTRNRIFSVQIRYTEFFSAL